MWERIGDIGKGIALVGVGGVAGYILPDKYKALGLIPAGAGIYYIAKGFVGEKYEFAKEGEWYNIRITVPKDGDAVPWWINAEFTTLIENPYDVNKEMYIRGWFYHIDKDKHYFGPWGKVKVKARSRTYYTQWLKHNIYDRGNWSVIYGLYYFKWPDDEPKPEKYMVGLSQQVIYKVVTA